MVIICIAAIGLKLLDFPLAPMLLGFILGGMLEDNLRRALLINDESLSFLWERPLTAVIMTLAMLALFGQPLLNLIRSRISQKKSKDVFDSQ